MGKNIEEFLSGYPENVTANAQAVRKMLLASLPGITEQLDLPARMIAYCYGQRYADTICVLIPSKKGLKLGFNRGTLLPDPGKLLEGTGKIARYVVITGGEQISSALLLKMIHDAYELYLPLQVGPSCNQGRR